MSDEKEIILQTKNVEYIKNTLGKEQWIQVCGHRDMNGADAGFWCGLVSVDHIEDIYHDVGWDISANEQGGPGFEGNGYGYQYKSNLLNDGFESILYYREFYGAEKNYVELSQEFILLNNLRYNSTTNSYYAMHENGEAEEAVRYVDENKVDLLILDVMMQDGIDGLTAAEMIKQKHPEVKIILTTSTSETSWEQKAKDAVGTHGAASGLMEYQLALTVSAKLRQELTGRGYTVVMTREGPSELEKFCRNIRKRSLATGSSPEQGSSRMMSIGSTIKARPIITLLFSPCERQPQPRFLRYEQPILSRMPSAFSQSSGVGSS